MRETSKAAYQTPLVRKRKRQQSIQNYKNKKTKLCNDIDQSIETFRKLCEEFPVYACVVCGRTMFRYQVVKFDQCKYKNHKTAGLLNSLSTETECFVCTLCHRTLKSGKIPSQSLYNNMNLCDVGDEISQLNNLERHLISPVIPFMKIVNLPKNTQKGIHGPVVSVKSDLQKVTTTLPRNLSDESFIKVKLKRKLSYRGHHLYQEINPNRIFAALDVLKTINPHFAGIDIQTDAFDNEQDDLEKQQESTEGDNSIAPPSDKSTDHPETGTLKGDETPVPEPEDQGSSAPLETSLQPSDLSQYCADSSPDSVFSVAPAEGNIPIRVINTEGQAFPTYFTDGKNTYKEDRSEKLSLKRYFNSRLFSNDARFASDPEYIFFAQYTAELNEIFSSISIAMRKSGSSSDITSQMLADSKKVMKMLKKDECYRFMQTIRGFPQYWDKTMRDLFAMLKQLGIPTFFITFSAADRRWTEIVEAICAQQGIPVPEDLDWLQYYNIINSNIVTATRMFDKRLHDFIKCIIMSPSNPIGKVQDIFGRLEFQARGWPHYHGLVWIENAPEWGKSSDKDVTSFIDKYISCQLPDETEDRELYDIVSSVQVHSKSHTKSCKKGGKDCRFNFPRPCSQVTFIASPPKDEEDKSTPEIKPISKKIALDTMEKFWEYLTTDNANDLSTKTIFDQSGITQDTLQKALNVLSQRPKVMYERQPRDCWVNAYNPTLLRAWNGNMDIQYVLDPYSCTMYIMSYITKAEKELGELIKAAQKEAREDNLEAVEELRKLGFIYLTHREISAMEAVYRVCGLKLKHCSREVIWIPTDPDSTRITLPLHVIQTNADRGDDNVWMTNILDRYRARPLTDEFNNMCLASFASKYRVITKTKPDSPEEDNEDEDADSNPSKKYDCFTIWDQLS